MFLSMKIHKVANSASFTILTDLNLNPRFQTRLKAHTDKLASQNGGDHEDEE